MNAQRVCRFLYIMLSLKGGRYCNNKQQLIAEWVFPEGSNLFILIIYDGGIDYFGMIGE